MIRFQRNKYKTGADKYQNSRKKKKSEIFIFRDETLLDKSLSNIH